MDTFESYNISTIVPNGERPITPLRISQSKRFCIERGIAEWPVFTVRALWDSGATACFISDKFAQKMGFIEEMREPVRSTHAREFHPVYRVDIDFGDGYGISHYKAAGIETGNDFDFIIGMNAIRKGDLLLTDSSGLLQVYFKPR
ncbi:MAG: hypothetical protein LBM77_09615 [Spirochaetaceae bacterium]|jgi:hypothetical protein|nr:hypothetical protein [Spirochaetaceae bacterium]